MTSEVVQAAQPVKAIDRRDRWSDWAVVGVFVVALLLGWLVMALVLGQHEVYSDASSGLTVRYPKGWLLKADAKSVFQAVDSASGSFKTTYQVRTWPIEAAAAVTPTLAVVLNDAALSRAQGVAAFRTFELVEGQVRGEPSMEASYAYVVDSANLLEQKMPVVVEGLDVAVARNGKAYVFTLLAAEDAFKGALREFRRFVRTAEIQ